jgi:hypothetical protein
MASVSLPILEGAGLCVCALEGDCEHDLCHELLTTMSSLIMKVKLLDQSVVENHKGL